MKIGFFDSGIGGLTVLHESYARLPKEIEYCYYADTDNLPYGEKSAEQINGYAERAVSFLLEHGANSIVVACNTATSVAIATLREKHKDVNIIGMEPAVKKAVEGTQQKLIFVTATNVTVHEKKLKNLIERTDKTGRVRTHALQELVKFAEREEFDGNAVESYLRAELADCDPKNYSALVLGCTHFNYFKPVLKRILGGTVSLIDGAEGTVRRLAQLENIELRAPSAVEFENRDDLLGKYRTEYYFSGRSIRDEKSLNHLLALHRQLEYVRNI